MKKLIIFTFLLLPFFLFSQTCSNLPKSFISYLDAINKVKGAKFAYADNISTLESSFITSANFYSCDHKAGFLIIGLKCRLYIHQNLPISLWNNFKRVNSLGNYYTKNIKNRYKLQLLK